MTETAANDEKLRKLRVQYIEMREILTQSSVYFNEVGHRTEALVSLSSSRLHLPTPSLLTPIFLPSHDRLSRT